MTERLETIAVKRQGGRGYRLINKADYDANPKAYTLHKGKVEGGEDGSASDPLEAGRNPSGTFAEPTPTDIRYPDKDETEFENNHGAFVGKSAAEMRAEEGLPDAPGGLNPDPNFQPGDGPPEDRDPLDHDGDGRKGGSVPAKTSKK